MKRLMAGVAIASLAVLWSLPAAAQSPDSRFDVGVQVLSARSSELDGTDVGLGGRFSWRPGEWVGIESEVALYPRPWPHDFPFSRRRVEGLFGATVGPDFGRARIFAKLRPGFLNIQEAPEPLACILIYPPPLSCTLAAGRTLLAIDIGGGLELSASERAFARIEAGDRLVKYPGPVFDNSRRVREASFFGHDFRFAAGAGWRF